LRNVVAIFKALISVETRKRTIGEELAKRIGRKFKLDYRIFLQKRFRNFSCRPSENIHLTAPYL